jgi:hypothetical protein
VGERVSELQVKEPSCGGREYAKPLNRYAPAAILATALGVAGIFSEGPHRNLGAQKTTT